MAADLDATVSFLSYLREKIDPERKREVFCAIGIPAVADGEAKSNLRRAAKGCL